jgi:hypothetical protein
LFALDEPTARRLRRLAARWQVSQAEVVRRSLEQAEEAEVTAPDVEARIMAARRLRERVQAREVDVTACMKTARASRR